MAADVNMIEVKKTKELTKPVNGDIRDTSIKTEPWHHVLGNIKDEFRKISWTNPDELITYTKIVVIGTFCFGMGIYLMDLIIQGVLGGLGAIIRMIGG